MDTWLHAHGGRSAHGEMFAYGASSVSSGASLRLPKVPDLAHFLCSLPGKALDTFLYANPTPMASTLQPPPPAPVLQQQHATSVQAVIVFLATLGGWPTPSDSGGKTLGGLAHGLPGSRG